jgi:hypothetical protein
MATLTRSQIAMFATAAALPHPALWGEIGMAESSGRTDVVNGIGAVGLFQINQPVHVKAHPGWTVAWLKNPANNAAAARTLYRQDLAAGGDGYRPWDASRPQWSKTAAARAAGLGTTTSASSSAAQAGLLGDLGSAVPGAGLVQGAEQGAAAVKMAAAAGMWLANPHNWLRIAYAVAGLILIGVGLEITVQQKAAGAIKVVLGSNAGQAAKKVITKGKGVA